MERGKFDDDIKAIMDAYGIENYIVSVIHKKGSMGLKISSKSAAETCLMFRYIDLTIDDTIRATAKKESKNGPL